MDKTKDTIKRGLDKVVKTDLEPQEPGKSSLDAVMPSQQQRGGTAAGLNTNSTTAGDTGKQAMGQPMNKPRP
ncbi:hypothetical protein N658DRAFT_509032 [Parathielavia hyrcaniae]|uniref:Uncharacterized protein n=1 Tax=Parathielavia hyrcaniae TaxID=113614 RepID=A0AAN6SZA7_9PEZI|nr:hypothetical protein N658DRAFT_509032 [Parathielavia hyrcaniae]